MSERQLQVRLATGESYFLKLDANPRVAFASDIKISMTVPDVPDLLVFMQVLVEEHLYLVLVHTAHLLRRHGDFVSVLVSTAGGQIIHPAHVRDSEVENPERFQRRQANGVARVMGQALVALVAFSSAG